ncbi:MAG: ABC transporter permease [Candidatus Omnitrophota bacterium]|jgi:NitT/TauT family transport system permease protein|nr:MAG: ABC transporter permease [Candidatus Omnitrophota bacterium]
MNHHWQRHRQGISDFLLGSLLPIAFLILWQWWAEQRSQVVPRPLDVLAVLAHPFAPPRHLDSMPLAHSCGISVLRVFLGFTAAALTAIPLGLLAGRITVLRRILIPFLEMGRPICPIAWLPVAILVFGFESVGSAVWGQESWRHSIADQLQFAMIAVIWWGGFFPIFVNTVHGVEQVKTLYLEAAAMLGASHRRIFLYIVLPGALPSIMTGLRVGLGISWMVIIAAEIFPGARAGLGYIITTSHQVAEYQYAFAAIVVIAVIGLMSNKFLYLASNRISRWQIMER